MKTKTEIWFERLKAIWLRKAANEVGDLVSNLESFVYYEDPFAGPLAVSRLENSSVDRQTSLGVLKKSVV